MINKTLVLANHQWESHFFVCYLCAPLDPAVYKWQEVHELDLLRNAFVVYRMY